MSIRIIIDSASDITKEKADALGLDFLPLKTIFGEEEYLDGITMSHNQFYEKLIETEAVPTTSQISPYEYEQIFSSVMENGDTAICITLSSKLSGSFQSANIAAADFEGKIVILDSENVCIGEQILILYALELRNSGKTMDEIVTELNKQKNISV